MLAMVLELAALLQHSKDAWRIGWRARHEVFRRIWHFGLHTGTRAEVNSVLVQFLKQGYLTGL